MKESGNILLVVKNTETNIQNQDTKHNDRKKHFHLIVPPSSLYWMAISIMYLRHDSIISIFWFEIKVFVIK